MSLLKNKKLLASGASLILLFVFILPIFVHADNPYTPLIQCGNGTSTDSSGKLIGACTFADFIETLNRIINWIISIATVIFTISAIYGGFLYMTSGEKPGNKDKAKSILWNTILGFVIILVSWLIIYTILNMLVDPSQKGSVMRFIGS